MQSQEGQGTLDECEASQRWGELTRIKSGCGFSKDAQMGKSFDPKMSIQDDENDWCACRLISEEK